MEIRRLNTIRGVAVLIVIVSHYSNESKILGGVLGNGAGQLGVMLFFLLSSFLMSFLYLDKVPNTQNLVGFCVARIARVIPLFFLVVFVSFFGNIIFPSEFVHFLYPIADLSSLISNLLLLSGVKVMWTIPPEIQFYAAFAFFWFLTKKLGMGIMLFPIALLGFYVFFPNPKIHEGTVFGLFFRLSILQVYACFVVGLLFGVLYKKWSVPEKYKSKYFLCSLAVIPLLFPMIFFSYTGYLHAIWNEPGILIAISLVFFSLVFLVPDGNFLLENKAGDFLGRVSYSTYLLHYPILMTMSGLGFSKKIIDGVIFILLTLVVSHLSFVFFESPARSFIKNRFLKNLKVEGR
ncbi:acyltransferase family protein [Dickeya lacustris]|uniref:Acyltransferase n=1 Tax=Dickeya lacustris TaxID=2259638 RepID=A0ABY8G349_9GAMM|nr:acyltransferase [Dickeya lacustris]WFN54344.1 acyltransferase [Dickeya lacustris]